MARQLVQLALLLVACVLVQKTYADEPEKIVGGTNARLGEFPYQVSLQVYGQHICGGTLISRRHVVTAAHCVNDFDRQTYNQFSIVTGTNSIVSGGQRHFPRSIRVHHNYRGTREESWKNDIAVITLQNPITVTSYQSPIKVATFSPPVNARLTLTGWGKLSAKGNIPAILQKTQVFALSNTNCQSRLRGIIHSTHICTLNRAGIGACQGDSGGPLVYNNELVGIVSWVIPCGLGAPDVFTRAPDFVSFIAEAIRLG